MLVSSDPINGIDSTKAPPSASASVADVTGTTASASSTLSARLELLRTIRRWGSPIPLCPSSKVPLAPWKQFQRRRPADAELERWLELWPDANWALVPARDVVIIDIDSAEGLRWFADQGGAPLTPRVKTARGVHIYLKCPRGTPLPARLHRGVEVVKTYALLPPSVHPEGICYQWIISPDEVGWELAEPPPWLKQALRRAARRKPTGSGHQSGVKRRGYTHGGHKAEANYGAKEAKKGNGGLPKPLRMFINDVLPEHRETDSNAPVQLAAAIIGHRIAGLCGERLVTAIEAVNRQLSKQERVDHRRVRDIAKAQEQHRYGWSSKVYAERTGTPLHVARLVEMFIKRWERVPREPVKTPPCEVTRRIIAAIFRYGKPIKLGVLVAELSVAEMATITRLSYHTIHARYKRDNTPGVWVTPLNGHKTWWIWAAFPHLLGTLPTYVQTLKKKISSNLVGAGFCPWSGSPRSSLPLSSPVGRAPP